MKLLSPQDLARISPYSVEYIRRNAADFGFVKMGDNSRKWLATEKMVESALCSIAEKTQSIGKLNSVTVELSSGAVAAKQIRSWRNELKNS